MKIIVQIDQTAKRKDGGDGSIYFDCDSFQFPEKDWFDFTFMVLTEWNGALFLMIKKKENTCILPFMDGSWAVRLTRKKEKCLLEFGIYDRFDKEFEHSEEPNVTIEFKELYDQLIQANNEVIEYVKLNSIDSDYYRSMESWFNKLIQLNIIVN